MIVEVKMHCSLYLEGEEVTTMINLFDRLINPKIGLVKDPLSDAELSLLTQIVNEIKPDEDL